MSPAFLSIIHFRYEDTDKHQISSNTTEQNFWRYSSSLNNCLRERAWLASKGALSVFGIFSFSKARQIGKPRQGYGSHIKAGITRTAPLY